MNFQRLRLFHDILTWEGFYLTSVFYKDIADILLFWNTVLMLYTEPQKVGSRWERGTTAVYGLRGGHR